MKREHPLPFRRPDLATPWNRCRLAHLHCFGGGGGSSSSGNTETQSTSEQLGASEQANLTKGSSNVTTSSGVAQGSGAKLNTGVDVAGSGNTITVGDTKAFQAVVNEALDSVNKAGATYASSASDMFTKSQAQNQQILQTITDLAKSSSGTSANDKLIYLAGAAALAVAFLATRK